MFSPVTECDGKTLYCNYPLSIQQRRITGSVNNALHIRNTTVTVSFTHCHWLATLGVHSAKRIHQSPELTILSHVNCFIQEEVIRFNVLLDSLHPRNTMTSRWSPILQGVAAVMILASLSSLTLDNFETTFSRM